MVSETESALEEIAFVRRLVERGRQSDARGGGLLIGIGVCFAAASLFHWGTMAGLIAAPVVMLRLVWMAAAIFSVVLAVVLNARTPRRTTADNVYNATRVAIWASIITLWIVLGIAGWRFQNADITELAAPLIFALNGGFWFIFSSVQERRSLRWVPILSFAAAVGLALLCRTPHFYLANAVAFLALFVLPGLAMRLRNRTVEAHEN
jgi:LytS/YehU family sensor histidine kinase